MIICSQIKQHPQSLQLGRDVAYELFVEISLEKVAAKAKHRDNVVQVLLDEMTCEHLVWDNMSTLLCMKDYCSI